MNRYTPVDTEELDCSFSADGAIQTSSLDVLLAESTVVDATGRYTRGQRAMHARRAIERHRERAALGRLINDTFDDAAYVSDTGHGEDLMDPVFRGECRFDD